MKVKNPSVAVAIISWNDWKNTTKLLESVFKSDYNNYDIIVVDNNSDNYHFEQLLNWCKKKKFTQLIYTIKLLKKKAQKIFIFIEFLKWRMFHLPKI